MPIKQSLTFKSQPILLFILFTLLLSSVFSCKSDKKGANPADLFDGPNSINFTVNGEQIAGSDQISKDLTMLQYQEDRMNKDHVLYVPVFDSIYIKDISQFKDGAPGERQWYIDEQKLDRSGREVAFYSEEVGPAIITLKFDDYNYVMKGVFFTEVFEMSDDIAESETETAEDEFTMKSDEVDNTSASTSEPEYNSKPRNTSTNTNSNTSSSTSYTQKKAATTSQPSSSSTRTSTSSTSSYTPPPVKKEITKVDFSVSKTNVETGEKIVFRDLSEPAIAVENRVWDWGDGNTMPTRGSTAGYSYYKPGNYTVKLCLNYTSKCQTRTITVTQAKESIVATPPPPKPEEKKVEKKPEVSKVVISAASKTQVGKPIEIKDETFPSEAVSSRAWYVDGSLTNLTGSKFSKTFSDAGVHKVKLCVNGSSTLCTTKDITIEEKPKPKPVKTSTTTKDVEEEFFAMASSRTGLRTSQRCPETEVSWHNAESEMVLSPTVRLELMNARIFGKKVAYGKATLSASDGSFTRVINNVQILPGPSTIEFGDFGVVLQPGKKYTLKIEPMPGEDMQLENGGSCNATFAADDRLGVSYKENVMVLYNIKFGY